MAQILVIFDTKCAVCFIFEMMRLLTLLLLCLYYLATCTGIRLNIHFCSSKFDGITFFEKASCCCDGKPPKVRCCSDHENFLKISDAHYYSKHEHISPDWFKTAGYYTIWNQYAYPGFTEHFKLENKDDPPLRYTSELNILQRVFRI